MALRPQTDQAFIREVEEEVRRDRALALWQRHAGLIIGAVVLALVLVAVALWWKSHRAVLAARDGEQLVAVLADAEQNRAQAKDPRLAALAQSSRPGYSALARMTKAGITAAADPKSAGAQFQAIAEDTSAPAPIRDLALIRATTLQSDTLTPAEIVARMKPLAQPGGPWFGSAGELTAAAYLKMNRRDLAGPLFAAIARDAGVPASLRGRAASMATALGQTVGTLPATGALKG